MSQFQANINVQCVKGGFVIGYPVSETEYVQEVATSAGKAIRIVKAAVEAYSQVTKSKDEGEAEAS